jgi:LysM repeat protein
MKTIFRWFCLFAVITAMATRAHAQDAATQQQLDQLSGQIQTIQETLTQQDKRITDLESKISALTDKVNQPGGNDYASADDLKKLAEQVQEIDKKRQEDNEKILATLEKLGKGGAIEPPHTAPDISTSPGPNTGNSTPNAGGQQQNGYYYTIAPGNTLSAIVKAYRAQGIKVSVKQILDANPGLSANNLIVGKKIFIPAPQ